MGVRLPDFSGPGRARQLSGVIGRDPDTLRIARDPDSFGTPRLDSGYKHSRHEWTI